MTVSPNVLVFTAENWSSPQSVRVTAADGASDAGNVTHNVNSSSTATTRTLDPDIPQILSVIGNRNRQLQLRAVIQRMWR